MNAVLLAPTPVTKDNLQAVIDAGWVDKATVCAALPPVRLLPATDRHRMTTEPRRLRATRFSQAGPALRDLDDSTVPAFGRARSRVITGFFDIGRSNLAQCPSGGSA